MANSGNGELPAGAGFASAVARPLDRPPLGRALGRRTLVAAGAVAALGRPHVARAAPRAITLAQIHPEASQLGQGCLAMADAVAHHPDLMNVLRIDVHHDAEFGDEAPMLADCRSGTLDMVATGTFCAFDVCPEIGLLDIPFLFANVARGRAAFDGPLGTEYAALLRSKDLHVVAWLEHGLRQITANRPIRKPSDMLGLKLRVPQSPIAAECFRTLGADVRMMPFKQVYEALRGEIIDAQENPIATVKYDNFYKVQKYLNLTRHIYSAAMITVSSDIIADLTEVQRAALLECGTIATKRSRFVAGLADREGLAWLSARGMIVIDDVDIAAFIAASRPNIDRLSQRFTTDRLARLIREAG